MSKLTTLIAAATALMAVGSSAASAEAARMWNCYSGNPKRDHMRGAGNSIAGKPHMNLRANARRVRQMRGRTVIV